ARLRPARAEPPGHLHPRRLDGRGDRRGEGRMSGLKARAVALAKRAYTGFYTTPVVARTIVSQFTRLYYQTPVPVRTWHDTRWLGVPVLKTPLDLWNYQEILHERRPDVVVECGTAGGGSALFLASVMELMDHGRVVSVDLKP